METALARKLKERDAILAMIATIRCRKGAESDAFLELHRKKLAVLDALIFQMEANAEP